MNAIGSLFNNLLTFLRVLEFVYILMSMIFFPVIMKTFFTLILYQEDPPPRVKRLALSVEFRRQFQISASKRRNAKHIEAGKLSEISLTLSLTCQDASSN